MVADGEGFLFPHINEDVCIKCGQCLKSCPVSSPKYENAPEPECYAVMASDEIRAKSSSGGVFSALAQQVIASGGIVFGAADTDVTDAEIFRKRFYLFGCYGIFRIVDHQRSYFLSRRALTECAYSSGDMPVCFLNQREK